MFQPYDSGADASTLSPSYGSSAETFGDRSVGAHQSKPEPRYESLRHMVFGSAIAVQNTIKLLHRLNYAEPNEWSKLIPTDKTNEVMAVLTKKVRVS